MPFEPVGTDQLAKYMRLMGLRTHMACCSVHLYFCGAPDAMMRHAGRQAWSYSRSSLALQAGLQGLIGGPACPRLLHELAQLLSLILYPLLHGLQPCAGLLKQRHPLVELELIVWLPGKHLCVCASWTK